MDKKLAPLFKWTGGKRREIVHFSPYYPDFVKSHEPYCYIEPFAGAAATYWALNNVTGVNIINDYDAEVMNFYAQVKNQNEDFLTHVQNASRLFQKKTAQAHTLQEERYYYWRNKDRNGGLEELTEPERAARFFIVNQLAFSGMRRFNSAGEFNVPYGHYKNLNCSMLTDSAHVELLKKTTLLQGDYSTPLLNNDNDNTFVFIDPPYTRVMKKYSANNEFGDAEQKILAENLFNLNHAKWMVVIDKSPLTVSLYQNYIKHTYPVNYGVNIKNRFSTDVEHLIATNY